MDPGDRAMVRPNRAPAAQPAGRTEVVHVLILQAQHHAAFLVVSARPYSGTPLQRAGYACI